VNYDPGSPAGKEYAIPLVFGRAEGAGTEDQQAAANTPFGVGITPPGSGGRGAGSGADDGGGASAGGGDGARGDGTAGGAAERSGESPADRRARILRAEEPGDAGTWTIGIGLAVLLSAGAFALALGRGRGRVHHAA
jgi:hypothetical protein